MTQDEVAEMICGHVLQSTTLNEGKRDWSMSDEQWSIEDFRGRGQNNMLRIVMLIDGASYSIARITSGPRSDEFAERIVKAVNSHDKLVEALEALQKQVLQSDLNTPSNEWATEALELTSHALALTKS